MYIFLALRASGMYNKFVGYMKIKIKYILLIIASCALLLCVFAAGSLFAAPERVWIGDIELASKSELEAGGGTVKYDADKRLLTLTGAEIDGGIRSEGSLNIELRGDSSVAGGKYGVCVLGDLCVFGDGRLDASGKRAGVFATGCFSVSERASLFAEGGKGLKIWGKTHASPFYTVEIKPGKASFRPPYTATLELGYGEPEYLRFKLGDRVERPADPERSGYWFDGWYADPELTLPFDFELGRNEDVTLYAGWIKIVYVAFDSWGGTDVPEAEIAFGDSVPEPPPPEREGYIFEGWYSDSRLTERFDFSKSLTENTALYAKWKKICDAEYRGIDVARYQLDIDWEAVKASGIDFAVIRAGFRGYGAEGTLNADDNFEANISGALQAGLDVGVYFFSQATSVAEAEEEAAFLLGLIDGRELTLPVFMDYEMASDQDGRLLGRLYEAGLSGREHAEICLAFCRAIEKAGYTAMVYTGVDMLSDGLAEALESEGYGVWLANWGVQTRYNGAYSFWQYSSAGKVEGISVQVDMNMRYVTSPGRVTGLKAEALSSQAAEKSARLTWDRVPQAFGYIIYRYDQKAGGYVEYARTRGASATEFIDSQPAEDGRYAVCAVVRQSGTDYRGGLSDAVSLPLK